MYYDKIFIKRDMKAFLNEMIYIYNGSFQVIRLKSFENLKSCARLMPFQFGFMKNSGEGIETILYYLENDMTKKDGVTTIKGSVIKFDGSKMLGFENFSCEFSDYDLILNSELIKHDKFASTWRKNIFLHLNEEQKKEYKLNCAKNLLDDELKIE